MPIRIRSLFRSGTSRIPHFFPPAGDLKADGANKEPSPDMAPMFKDLSTDSQQSSPLRAANEDLLAPPLLDSDAVKTSSREDAEDSLVASTGTPLDLPLNAPSTPYGNSTRHQWVGINLLSSYTLTDYNSQMVSTRSLILKRLPEQITGDPHFMAFLELTFATITTRTIRKDDVELQLRLCEERADSLRSELSKAKQDLDEITQVMVTLRELLESSDLDYEAVDREASLDAEANLLANMEQLIRHTAIEVPKLHHLGSKTSLLSDNSLDWDNACSQSGGNEGSDPASPVRYVFHSSSMVCYLFI